MKFIPIIKTLGLFNPTKIYDFREIRDEVMLFGADIDFARRQKSPLTNEIIDFLTNTPEFKEFDSECREKAPENSWKIDTRVNMLMSGQYPSIPGWHADSVPRGTNGQPDLTKCNGWTQHFMILVSDTPNPADSISGTEFVTNIRDYDVNPDNVWNSVNACVVADPEAKTRFVKERELVQFDQGALHRASPAKRNGFRLFFRMSYDYRPVKNEIRNHVQVYVDISNPGW